ncbi:hypothetical protein FBQ82_12055 [Anaerolineae bacterium CFX7]|nr:hypothetical protein [Anaerolineae bacterium CFX7]
MALNQKTPGRNEPCWCGSGKKYKHCHQHADEKVASEALQKSALWQALSEFVSQRKYDLDFRTAAQFFFGADEAPDPEGDAAEQADFEHALDYFLFDYPLSDNTRVIEHFATERGRMLSPRQRTWLTQWMKGAPALLEIVAVERGVGVQARDLLTNEIIDIRDKMGSETTTRWMIAFARVIQTDDHYELSGAGLNIAPRFRGMLLNYVEGLRGAYAIRSPEATLQEFLRAHAHLINQYILGDIDAEMRQLPIMLTPEGDVMEHAVATYEILQHADALARLRAAAEFQEMETDALDTRTFGWRETGESLSYLRSHGAPFEWKTPVGDANSVRALGTITLALDALTLEVISHRRLRAGKALLEKNLGDTIRFQKERVESFGEALAEHEDDALDAEDEFDDDFDFEDDDEFEDDFEDNDEFEDDDEFEDELDAEESSFDPLLPDFSAPPDELQARLALYRANYNLTWIDKKIPALDNLTPRQAVHTFGRRLQVIRLLKDFEAREAEIARRGETPFDWGAVARELGLSDQEFLAESGVEAAAHEMLSLLAELTALHQADQAWEGWQKFRELVPIQRAEDLWFAQVWDLETELTELVMELSHLLARFKRFDDACALLDDYITLEADALAWALAERQAVEVERAIYSDPRAVQAAVTELEKLAQDKNTAFQALIVLAELQEGLLDAPAAALETLQRAEHAAQDDSEEQRVYDTLLEHFDSFREYDAGKTYWHQSNDALAADERDDAGLARLLLACDELDEASAVVENMEHEETRAYFAGMIAARRGNLDRARQLWQAHLAEELEDFQWRWFEWTERSLYLRDSDALLEKLDPAAHENHQLMHWSRALAYAQRQDLANAARAADDARAAIRAQVRRMDYASNLRHERALAAQLGLSDAARRALNLDAPVE